MLSTRFNRWTIAAVTVAALAAPGSLLAQTPEHTGGNSAQFPSKADLKSLTTSGSYLAARHASVERDANSAAAFYRSALRTDPKNNELLDRVYTTGSYTAVMCLYDRDKNGKALHDDTCKTYLIVVP